MFWRRKKPFSLLLLIPIIIVLLSLLFIFIFLKSITAPVAVNSDDHEFVVAKGQTAKVIAQNLEDAKLIRSRYGFRYALKRLNLDNSLQAGIYTLNPAMNAYEVARALTLGISDIKITIPEGYRLEQIAELAEAKLGIPYGDFIKNGKNSEGYLFPDTYFVHSNVSAEELIKLMKNNFARKFGSLDQKIVILASLVERETKGKDEKPVVAGILLKRLDNGWPLELDATIQYILGKKDNWWPNTTLVDRQKKSPYNTYLNQGLPPSPISNPGADSLNAVLYPQVSDYWFYLHTPDGSIYYAVTNAEHTANIAKYLK